jgi:hypothetical protein
MDGGEQGPETGMKLDELDKALQNLGLPKWLSSRIAASVFLLVLLSAGYLFLERELGWHKLNPAAVSAPAPMTPTAPAPSIPSPSNSHAQELHKQKNDHDNARVDPPPVRKSSRTIEIGPGTTIQQKTTGDCSPAVVGELKDFNCNTAPKPRIISEEDYDWMREALARTPGTLRGVSSTMEPETMQLAKRLDSLFRDAGWTVKFWGRTQMRITDHNSMEIYSLTPPGAACIALKHANIPMTVFLMADQASEDLSLQVGPPY